MTGPAPKGRVASRLRVPAKAAELRGVIQVAYRDRRPRFRGKVSMPGFISPVIGRPPGLVWISIGKGASLVGHRRGGLRVISVE